MDDMNRKHDDLREMPLSKLEQLSEDGIRTIEDAFGVRVVRRNGRPYGIVSCIGNKRSTEAL